MTATLVDHDRALSVFADTVGRGAVDATDPVAVRGHATRWDIGGPSTPGTRLVDAPSGIVSYEPAEMTVRVRAGTSVTELHEALAEHGQRTALPDRGGTVGGALAVGENSLFVSGRGTIRSSVLQVRYVSAEGRVVNAGGPTVKNVTGFDLPRLMVGSLGTLGLLAEATLRTNPVPPVGTWLAAEAADPFVAFDVLQRPSAVLWNGSTTWVQIEGHGADVAAERSVLDSFGAYREVDGPPQLPGHRWSITPAAIRAIEDDMAGEFVAVVGVGLVYATRPQQPRELSPAVRLLHGRMKANFDPTGRLNPGRHPGTR